MRRPSDPVSVGLLIIPVAVLTAMFIGAVCTDVVHDTAFAAVKFYINAAPISLAFMSKYDAERVESFSDILNCAPNVLHQMKEFIQWSVDIHSSPSYFIKEIFDIIIYY